MKKSRKLSLVKGEKKTEVSQPIHVQVPLDPLKWELLGLNHERPIELFYEIEASTKWYDRHGTERPQSRYRLHYDFSPGDAQVYVKIPNRTKTKDVVVLLKKILAELYESDQDELGIKQAVCPF